MPDLPLTSFQPPDSDGSPVEAGTVLAGMYKLLEPIGEGGMGSVWMAAQTEPVKRHVAVKLIKAGMDSKAVLARFEAERQALALMDHPNIAKVLDAGTTTGRPFFVMELVKGTPITEFCDQRRLTSRQRLELFVPVCQAIQHAHQKGVIHRDIKPSNVLVALHDDKPVPKVIDFGVAKATGTPLTEKTLHTGFDAVVGTPAYMSPEQATFNQLDIDTRTDVYSLGVLLYELLTGTTPIERERFKRAALDEMLRVVREEEPPRPSTRLSSTEAKASIAAVRSSEPAKLSNLFRGELDWIAMKALEKERNRRYDTANGLARDVQRYLADEVVEARPPSVGYRVRKFVRRYRGRVTAAVVILLALIGGLIGTAYGVIESRNQAESHALRIQAEFERDAAGVARDREAKARSAADAARQNAEAAQIGLAVAQEKLAAVEYGRTMQVAHQEWRENNVAGALALLAGTQKNTRGWEWRYIHRLCNSDLLTLRGHRFPIWTALFNPDGSHVMTVSSEGAVKMWDASTGSTIRTIKIPTDDIVTASFNADGSRMVTGGGSPTSVKAIVWDTKAWTVIRTLEGHSLGVMSAMFSRDGSRIVTGSFDQTARVWDAEKGTTLLTLKGHTNAIISVAFSPDGSKVATASADHTARLWDARTGDIMFPIKGHTGEVASVSFSPDGARLLTGSWDKTAKIWDAKTGTVLLTLKGHSGGVTAAAFSPNAAYVVTGSGDKSARVWDAKTGDELLVLKGHTESVLSASFSPDGSLVATGSEDRTARVWSARARVDALTLKGSTNAIQSAAFSPDGARVFLGRGRGFEKTATMQVSDAKAGTKQLTMIEKDNIVSASFSADGTRLLSVSSVNVARVWDAKTGAELQSCKGHPDHAASAAFSPDGSKVATGGDKTATVWDAKTGVMLCTLNGHTGYVLSVAFSPDGSRVATVDGRTSRVWDARTGEEVLALKGHTDLILSVTFSPDGTKVLTGCGDKKARMWDARSCISLVGPASVPAGRRPARRPAPPN